MAWRLARSLITLRDEVNRAYPNRSKVSDGTIGDTAHAARCSRHNPTDSVPEGVVCALDLTHDPGKFDAHAFAERLRLEKAGGRGHPELAYLVSNRRIASPTNNWAWRSYSGSNPHTAHIHVAVGNGTDCAHFPPWDGTQTWMTWDVNPVVGPFFPDISHFNGGFNMRDAYNRGCRYVAIKVGGADAEIPTRTALYIDESWLRRAEEARALGMAIIFFWYLSPEHEATVATQMRVFTEQARRFIATGPVAYGFGLDIEELDLTQQDILRAFAALRFHVPERTAFEHYQGDMAGGTGMRERVTFRSSLSGEPLRSPYDFISRPRAAIQQKASGQWDSNKILDADAYKRICGQSQPTVPPLKGPLMLELLQCTDADAAFLAYTVGGVAAQVEWADQATYAPFLANGVPVREVSSAQLKNCTLIGPLPHGDTRREWSGWDFRRHVPAA